VRSTWEGKVLKKEKRELRSKVEEVEVEGRWSKVEEEEEKRNSPLAHSPPSPGFVFEPIAEAHSSQ